MEVKNASVQFGRLKDDGPVIGHAAVAMDNPVSQVAAFLTGFRANFVGSDHELGKLQVALRVDHSPGSRDVAIEVTYGLRDWSGDWDDAYSGEIFFCVVGE